MKKVILAFSFITASLFATAQKKGFTGHWILSGELGYSTSSPTGTGATGATQSVLQVVPIVGVFAAPKTLVALGIGDVNINNFGYEQGLKANSWVFEPLVRQFFTTQGDGKFLFWGQLDVPIMPGSVTVPASMSGVTTSTSTKFTGTQWGVELRPGITYILSNHWQVEGSVGLLGYSHRVNPALNAAAGGVGAATEKYNDFNFLLSSGNLHGAAPNVFNQFSFGVVHFF